MGTPWERRTTTRSEGWGKEDMGEGVVAPPSVSSWARPPPGTSCRKSLRRQKSRRGRVLLKHCSTAFRKHWGAPETAPSSPQTRAREPQVFPKSARPPPSSTAHSCQKGGSHRIPQVSEAHVTRAQEQRVVSLEVRAQSAGPRVPTWYLYPSAACCPSPSSPVLHPQTVPFSPHWVSGSPYLAGHEQ